MEKLSPRDETSQNHQWKIHPSFSLATCLSALRQICFRARATACNLDSVCWGLINSSVCWAIFFWNYIKILSIVDLKELKWVTRISNQFLSAWSWWFTPTFGYFDERGLIRLSRLGECAKKAEQAQPTTNLNYPSTIDHMKDALCKVIPPSVSMAAQIFCCRSSRSEARLWLSCST